MQQTVNLSPNTWARVGVAGFYAAILSTGTAPSVELRVWRGPQLVEELATARRGLKLRAPEGFTHVEVRAASAAAVELVISAGVVDIDASEGATVSVTATQPLPVSNDRGSPGNLLYVSGVSLSDAPATGFVEPAAVSVTSSLTTVAAADATRRRLAFTNLGPDPVALGGAGLTWAKRCIVLQVDDTWVEERAANLAWSAITASGTTASVTVQGITA